MGVKFKGTSISTSGNFPKVGDTLPEMKLVKSDLSELNTNELKGKKVVFNIFPSVDTAVCAMQLTKFANQLKNREDVALVFTSLDLPFAFSRFCSAEGINNAITTSDFRYRDADQDRKSTRLNSSHVRISYAVFCLKKKKKNKKRTTTTTTKTQTHSLNQITNNDPHNHQPQQQIY